MTETASHAATTASAAAAPANELADQARQVATDGYTILRNVVAADLVAELVETIDRLTVELAVPFGPNPFLGTHTRRIFNLLARDITFAQVPVHPAVLPLVEKVLDPGCLLSSMTAIDMHPGQEAQPIHTDDGSLPLPRPHIPVTCTAIWTLTDFNLDNGATRVVPGSHRIDRIPKKGEADPSTVERAVMPAGSVLVYDGALWHGGDVNRSAARRMGIVCNYCAGWLRQEENQMLGLEREYVKTLPARVQELVGYSVYRGHFGHVDQVNPRTWIDPEATTDMVWKRMR